MERLYDDYDLVSVIIPVYNRKDYIERAVESILEQTYKNIEVIIIDDGSEDGTIEILKKIEMKSNKIKVFLQKHKGANAARNLGMEKSKGRFLAFQDSDDEWLPDKLEKQISYMIKNNYSVCYSSFLLDEFGRKSVIPIDYDDRQKYETDLIKVLKCYNVVSTQTLVIDRSIISEVGVFDEEMPRFQDYEYIIRIIQKKKIGYIHEPLVKVYRTPNSISNDSQKEREAERKLLIKHSDFINMEDFLTNRLKKDIVALNKIQLNERIEKLDVFLKRNLNNRVIDLYKIVSEMLADRCKVFNDSYIREYEKRVEMLHSYNFAIYGAGIIGRKVYDELKQKNLIPQCFLVTKKQNCNELCGIPVLSLEEWDGKDKDIIIGVSIKLQNDLIDNLVRIGYMKYFRYPDKI